MRYRHYIAMARTVVQITLDEMEKLSESLEDIEAEIEIVIDDSVMGIETLLDIMFITSWDGRESN